MALACYWGTEAQLKVGVRVWTEELKASGPDAFLNWDVESSLLTVTSITRADCGGTVEIPDFDPVCVP